MASTEQQSMSAAMPGSTSFPTVVPPSAVVEVLTNHKALATAVTILASLLLLEQVVYRSRKQHLPGSKWTIPIIGKFMDSRHPTMEGYMRQWAMGALSAISVFHM